MNQSPLLASTAWLASHLDDPSVGVIDASWYLPSQNRDGNAEYATGHIPGAVRFDIEAISDKSSSLPHMMPSSSAFVEAAERLGLCNDMTLVVYDGSGLFAAARVWWMFRTFGARDVRVLDGGLPAWVAEGRPVVREQREHTPCTFTPHFDSTAIAAAEDVRRTIETRSAQVVDVRPVGRFRGDAPEPRPGVRAGHVPGSLNLPFDKLLVDGRLKPAAEIEAALINCGVDLDKPIVSTCGSGVTAAILALALESIGRPQQALYDGSWAEWGSRKDYPVAIGPAKLPG